MSRRNEFDQPIGEPLHGWAPPPAPDGSTLEGRWARLERVDVEAHATELFNAYAAAEDDADWTYMGYGPWSGPEAFRAWLSSVAASIDPLFYAVIDTASKRAVGLASYLRITPAHGCIEAGHIHFARVAQRSPVTTEALYLMLRHAFELGYRRFEWKCDALNAPSRRAAERLGFTFEGIFRQAIVYKGRNRDTAWYAMLDHEWPAQRRALEAWLAPENFDGDGTRVRSLDSLRAGR